MIIKKDSIGDLVLRWQQFLVSQGYSLGSLDGNFGTKTDAATKLWQKKNGLTADGVVGDASFTKAKALGFIFTEVSVWYPPRPNFRSPSNAQVEAMFGKFQYQMAGKTEIKILGDWVSKNIVEVQIKQLIGVPGSPANGKVRFHKKGADQLKEMFSEFERQGLHKLVISWAGSFYPRLVRGSTKNLSNHSWGTAFDINAAENWLGIKPAAIGKKGSLLKLVPIANSYGFYWGGHYQSRLDGMHFELALPDMFP